MITKVLKSLDLPPISGWCTVRLGISLHTLIAHTRAKKKISRRLFEVQYLINTTTNNKTTNHEKTRLTCLVESIERGRAESREQRDNAIKESPIEYNNDDDDAKRKTTSNRTAEKEETTATI